MADLDTVVYGISLDDVETQGKFAKAQKLNFKLISDPDGSGADKYGVRRGRYTRRVTFVIDEEGVLREIDESVDVSSHGSDLASLIAELQEE